jgi:hypothetical protein
VALALDASSPALVTATATTVVTASFTAPANALLVAFINYDTTASTAVDQTVTDSGGLTWTLKGRKSSNTGSTGGTGTSGGAEIWWAQTTSSTARTVTATQTGSLTHKLLVKVFTDTGVPSTGAVAGTSSGTVQLPSASLTTTAPNSWVWSCNTDWNAGALGTAGSGQTLTTTDESQSASLITTHVWRQTATTPSSGTVVTNNQTAPTQIYNMLIVEVLANSSGGVAPWVPKINQISFGSVNRSTQF